jgi:hypothetical protein
LVLAEPSLTRVQFDKVDAAAAASRPQQQAGGAGGRTTYQALQAADRAFYEMRHMAVRVCVWLVVVRVIRGMALTGSAIWVCP